MAQTHTIEVNPYPPPHHPVAPQHGALVAKTLTMIKVTLGASKTQEVKPFPKLMECTGDCWAKGAIVLFFSPGRGIRITNAFKGDLSEPLFDGVTVLWPMEHFTDYNEPVTIQNA